MPTAQDQIALNESANQANEQYVTSLIAKASRGEQLRQEELEALIDYKAAKNREIRVNDLIQRGATGKLNSQEIEELKNYRNGITAQQPADLSSVPAIYREGAQSVALSDTRRLTGQDKVFAKAFGKIGPIADVQISEVQGDTPLLRLVDKIYGSENWTLEYDKVLVKPKGQTDFLPLPIEDPVPTLQRTGISAGLGAGGELVGSLGGIPGAVVGAGAGTAAGENINYRNAIKDANKLGLLDGSEQKVFDDVVRNATITGGTLGAVFGSGVPIVKGVFSATAGKIAQKTGQSGLSGLKNLPQAIRFEDESLAQGGIDALRKFTVSGKELDRLRGRINTEQLSDKLITEFSNIPVGAGGDVAAKSVRTFINSVNQESDGLFVKAIANVEQNLAKGKPVAFYDIGGLYNQLESKLLKEASVNDMPQVRSFLSDLKNELNFTKQQVANGGLPVKGAASKQFQSTVNVPELLDTAVFGPGQMKAVPSQVLDTSFDPSKITARDYNKTKNFIKDELTRLENPKYILSAKQKKDITQFLKAFEQPFAQGGDETIDIATQIGVSPNELIKGNPFLGSGVKAPKNAQDFLDITKGYQIRKRGFEKLSPEAREIVLKNPTNTAIEKSLLKADPLIARQIRNTIDNFAAPEEKQIFNTSIKANLFNPSSSAGKKQLQRETQSNLASNILEQSQSPDELIAQGIKPKEGLLRQAEIPSGQRAGAPTQTVLQGSRAANLLEGQTSTTRELLGADAKEVLKEAQQLSGHQVAAGIPQSAADLTPQKGLTNTLQKLANPQGGSGLLGGIVSDIGNFAGAVSRPVAGGTANVAELLKTATFAPGATVPNVGGFIFRNELLDEENRQRLLRPGLRQGGAAALLR